MSGLAEEVTDADIERGIAIFSRRSLKHGGPSWTADDVRGPIRLFRAIAREHSMLAKDGRPDHRIPVEVTR